MLEFFGEKYAKNNKEFTESLFSSKTCNGFYKKRKNGTLILNMQKEPVAYIVHNSKQGYFVVTATNTSEGVRYMYGTSEKTEMFLGISDVKLSDLDFAIRQLTKE